MIDPAVWSEAWKSAFAATASELRVLARRHSKRELAYLACHFVNKMVAGKGLTWYSSDLPMRTIQDLGMIRAHLPTLERLIDMELSDAG